MKASSFPSTCWALCCPLLKFMQSLSKQQFPSLLHHTPFENPMKITVPFQKKTTVLQRYTNTNFIWHFKRLKRPLETHHKTLMAEPEANQSKNQGVIFFLVKEMFKHAHKKTERNVEETTMDPTVSNILPLLFHSFPPNFKHFCFCWNILK